MGRRDGSVSKKDEEEEGKMRSGADNKRALNYETDFKMGGVRTDERHKS